MESKQAKQNKTKQKNDTNSQIQKTVAKGVGR